METVVDEWGKELAVDGAAKEKEAMNTTALARKMSQAQMPSDHLSPCKVIGMTRHPNGEMAEQWENDKYYGLIIRHKSGFFVGNSPWAMLSISAADESALHDWRDYQRIKNDLVGREWEAVELYPSESRLKDPSNRFYLWCAPAGCFQFGFNDRIVCTELSAIAPQRPFTKPPADADRIIASVDDLTADRALSPAETRGLVTD